MMASNQSKVKEKLLKEKQRLENELAELQKGETKPGEQRDDPFGKREEAASEATEMENHEALKEKVEDLISDADKAIEKLGRGTYGKCDSCGQPIGAERLEALPTARLCLKCKTSDDKRGTRR